MRIYYSTERRELLGEVLSREGYAGAAVVRDGKPRLEGGGLFFNLTHTAGLCAVAVGAGEVGIDAERRDGRVFPSLTKKMTPREREEDFYELWTAKEAFVKYRGGTLASMLKGLEYRGGTLFERGEPVRAHLAHFLLEGCTVCVCTATAEPFDLIRI